MDSASFIQTISKGLAIDQKRTRSAFGILIGFVIQHASAETAKKMLTTLPWAHSLLGGERVPPMTIAQINAPCGPGETELGNLDTPPHGLGLVGALEEIGVTPDQTHVIVMRFLDFVAHAAGETLALEILQEVPDLDPFDESPPKEETPPLDIGSEREGTTCRS